MRRPGDIIEVSCLHLGEGIALGPEPELGDERRDGLAQRLPADWLQEAEQACAPVRLERGFVLVWLDLSALYAHARRDLEIRLLGIVTQRKQLGAFFRGEMGQHALLHKRPQAITDDSYPLTNRLDSFPQARNVAYEFIPCALCHDVPLDGFRPSCRRADRVS